MSLRRMLLPLALLLTLPTLAFAGPLRPWIAGGLGASTYHMTDVNDDIGDVNSALSGSGLRMKQIDGGLGFGIAGGVDLGNGLAFGIGYDRFPANSDVGDWSGSIEYDFPGSFIRGFTRYSFQGSNKANAFVEGSVGRVSTSGEVTVSVTGSGSVSGDVEGSGFGFEECAGFELWASPQFAFTGSAGFRQLAAKDVTLDGTNIRDNAGGEYTIDYGGMFMRLGLKVVLTP
ncbi:MAG: hypothetical protein HZA61_13710 [Candidatus Eisenbacteria bacterium]|uniref:Porin family protein n=1 Tax=Eiseniibacteriota bacterium TaxID=2212470 RepID=A0A933SDS3_UNCEI|nr:hypothetical protein [Candidatus Eisenbacteria bacterium]